ncbi:helix-turn-helix domain-containing protein [Aquamicrobium terrae]|uniref:Chromosomal replication initiation ATPase DnaA n=1 Tax=Aquamicrobium terrae TaxID=1324945 RepID=A0ABV2MY74_9HYPH
MNDTIVVDLDARDKVLDWAFVLALVANETGISVAQITAPTRVSAKASRSRQLAIYLARVCLSITLTDIGRLFGRDRATVIHACALIEDQRDDPAFDAFVTNLEAAIAEWQRGRCRRRVA